MAGSPSRRQALAAPAEDHRQLAARERDQRRQRRDVEPAARPAVERARRRARRSARRRRRRGSARGCRRPGRRSGRVGAEEGRVEEHVAEAAADDRAGDDPEDDEQEVVDAEARPRGGQPGDDEGERRSTAATPIVSQRTTPSPRWSSGSKSNAMTAVGTVGVSVAGDRGDGRSTGPPTGVHGLSAGRHLRCRRHAHPGVAHATSIAPSVGVPGAQPMGRTRGCPSRG